jgi:AcrR family transcriptional regulator
LDLTSSVFTLNVNSLDVKSSPMTKPRTESTSPTTRAKAGGPRPAARASAPRAAGRSYGGISGEDRRAERRERFIEAGITAFGRDGFRGTTTRSVCAEAQLTQRYFYESFDDLEALFLAVAIRLGERVRAVLVAPGPEGDPRAFVQAQLTRYFQLLKRDPAGARILLLEVYTASTRVGELALRFTEELAVLVRQQIEAAFPHLLGRGIDAQLVATALVGATHHLALRWILSGYRESLQRIVETATVVYLGSAFATATMPHKSA